MNKVKDVYIGEISLYRVFFLHISCILFHIWCLLKNTHPYFHHEMQKTLVLVWNNKCIELPEVNICMHCQKLFHDLHETPDDCLIVFDNVKFNDNCEVKYMYKFY